MMVLAIIGFGPLSLTCLIGIYVVIARPRWFRSVTANLYGKPGHPMARAEPVPRSKSHTSAARLKTLLGLLALLILDIAPVPVTGSIGLYVIIRRPPWFKALVERVYGEPI